MIAKSLVRAATGTDAKRLRRSEESELVGPAESFPFGFRFGRRLHVIARAAEREGPHFEVDPPREVPDAGVGADDGRLRQFAVSELLQKLARNGSVPLARIVVTQERLVERDEPGEVVVLGLDRPLSLPGYFGYEVRLGE